MSMKCYPGLNVLIQVMACCQFNIKPSPEPMLINCQLEPDEQTPIKFKSNYNALNSGMYI